MEIKRWGEVEERFFDSFSPRLLSKKPIPTFGAQKLEQKRKSSPLVFLPILPLISKAANTNTQLAFLLDATGFCKFAIIRVEGNFRNVFGRKFIV